MDTQSLDIKFVARYRELEIARSHLLSKEIGTDSSLLLVRGDSGTGKSFFVRELLHGLDHDVPTGVFLYIDIPNDGYVSSRVLETLLNTVMIPGRMTKTSPIGVPETLTFESYRKSYKRRKVGKNFLRAIVHAIGGFLGLGSAVQAALANEQPLHRAAVDDELASYLAWASDEAPVFFAVDNIQFLRIDDRLNLEAVLQRAGDKMRLIAVDRTIDGESSVEPPIRCFDENQELVTIKRLTKEETTELIGKAFGEDAEITDRLASDIFTKTNGLAKDVEYCLRQFSLEVGGGAETEAIEGLLSTVSRLPIIHRQFLVISALLDGGVDKEIARGTVARLTAQDGTELNLVIDELIEADYLHIDSDAKSRLRPGHERIITAIRDLADEDLQTEVREALLSEISEVLEAPDETETETYLLHCFVGLQTARELVQNLSYVSQLIQSQYRQDQFSYLVTLSDEIYEILPLLPTHVLNDLMDAMQKSSAFEKGLQLLSKLDAEKVPSWPKRDLFRMQYLTQAYRFDEALEVFEKLEENKWTGVHHVNLLMTLDRLDEARAITTAYLKPEISEAQAIQRRNTVTLFDTKTALRHLDEAYTYFEQNFSDFRLATIDTNRSLVYLDNMQVAEAGLCLERAVERMKSIRSREIYQAQLNIAIRFALLEDYDGALHALNDASAQVPRPLILDQVKIEINRLIILHVAGKINPEECVEGFNNCSKRIQGLQLPYLRKVLAVNLAAARGELRDSPWGETGKVSITAKLLVQEMKWEMPMSVHWRY